MALGNVIRQRRDELGLTLDEVSRRTKYSKPYLSTIETGKVKNPPADELLVRLEEVLEFEKGLLVHIAHMARLPADVREAFESSRAENEHWRVLIQRVVEGGGDMGELLKDDKVRDALDAGADNVVHLSTAGRLVPVINDVAAGYPVDYDDKGYPPGGADEYVRCPDIHDPNAFAVRIVGDSMEPKYRQGDILIFSPALEVRNGDDCFVRMMDPHETTFKQVFFEGDTVRLQPRNHHYVPQILTADRVNGVWRAICRYERLDG